jgi:hypothetical protein
MSTIFGLVATLSFLGLVTGVGVLNSKHIRELVAAGLCPECCGRGEQNILMNGLEGCSWCKNTGTLATYNKRCVEQGLKPMVPKK